MTDNVYTAWLRFQTELQMLLGDWFYKLHMRRTASGWYALAAKSWRRAGQDRASH